MQIRKSIKLIVAALTVQVALVFSIAILPSDSYAAVGPGGSTVGGVKGCNGGNINGCPWTTNGQGWYQIPTDASNAPRGNNYWPTANATCKSEGATHVIAYVVLTGEGTLQDGWIYEFTWGWDSYGPYRGNITTDTASSMFEKLKDKNGYTFGRDVGWFCYDERTEWTINGQSYIMNNGGSRQQGWDALVAKPGDRLTWDHDLRNNPESENMDRNVSVNIDYEDFLLSNNNSLGLNPQSAGSHRGDTNILFFTNYGGGHTVVQDDVGERLCRRVAWQDKAWNDTSWGHSVRACARIPYSYSLVPEISNITDNEMIESERGVISVDGLVTNTGDTKSHRDIQWRVTQVKFDPGTTIKNKGGGVSASDEDPCAYFTSGAYYTSRAVCNTLRSGTDDNGFAYREDKDFRTSSTNIGSEPVGTRFCFAMSIKRGSSASTNWKHSQLYCLVISKKPKVQVWGGDLLVGRGMIGSDKIVSKVSTSVTSIQKPSDLVYPAPAGSVEGLWRTGVDDNGRKLPENSFDPHWLLTRVYRPGRDTSDTCQYIDIGSVDANLKKLPRATNDNSLQARVITEGVQDGVRKAGKYEKDVARNGDDYGDSTTYVWPRTSSQAGWIGQNKWGRNTSTPSCEEPTRASDLPDAQLMAQGNIYVFKLKDGFTIDSSTQIDLSTVRVTLRGAADNHLRVYVNGNPVSDWQELSWENPNSTATIDIGGGALRYDTANSLEIHVRTTWPLTGLLIDEISATAMVRQPLGNVFGSWAEYGVIPSGTVTGMASAAGYGGGIDNNALCGVSLLTFANARKGTGCSARSVGSYDITTASPAEALERRFIADRTLPDYSSPTETTNISTLAGGHVYTKSGPIRLTASGDMPAGKWIVINAPDSTVTIQGNLRYTAGGLNSVGDIPQLVIIARNIVVNSNVESVDAWLVTRGSGTEGYVKTCNIASPNNLRSTNCNNKLTVNGPVIANRLLMYRTYGAEAGQRSGDPAEVFNLRPDAYLWASGQQSGSGKIRTVQTTELPPRF